MSEVNISTHKGIEIKYSPKRMMFYAYDEEKKVAKSKTQKNLLRNIKSYLNSKSGLPIKVIHIRGYNPPMLVQIKSITKQGYSADVWISWREDDDTLIEKVWWTNDREFFKPTKANLETMQRILERIDAIKDLEKERDALVEILEGAYTFKDFGLED